MNVSTVGINWIQNKYYNMCIERLWAVRIVPAMENWIALVKTRMRDLDVTQEKLAERVGVTQGAVGHWLRRERQPRLDMMNRVLAELGMPHLQVRLHISKRGGVGESAGEYGAEKAPTTAEEDFLQYILCFRYPVLAWTELVGALPDDTIVQEQTDYNAQGKAYWLRVESDAMNAPTGTSVPEGTLILVDSGLQAAPGKLVIARQPGTCAVFRQLIEEGGQRYLRPLNPTYPTLLCMEGFEFLGVVVRSHARY